MTLTCEKWSPFRQAVVGGPEFQTEADSEFSATPSIDGWDRTKEQAENDINWRVLVLIRERPGIRPSEIAAALGFDDSLVFEIVNKLNDMGLVGPA